MQSKWEMKTIIIKIKMKKRLLQNKLAKLQSKNSKTIHYLVL